MHGAALEYGIVLKDLGRFSRFRHNRETHKITKAVIDRQFKGEIASTRALQAQVGAAVSHLCVPVCSVNPSPVAERRQGELEQNDTGRGGVGGRTHQGASTQCMYWGTLVEQQP